MRTPFNELLFTLVVLELLAASVGLPVNAASAVYGRGQWRFGQAVCNFTAFTVSVAGGL